MRQDIIVQLKGLDYLSNLREENLWRIAEASQKRFLCRDEMLFEEGEAIGSLYLVCSGSVRLYKSSAEGRELIIRVVGSGELCGCESLFRDGRYLMNAAAQEDTEVIVMSAERFKEVFVAEMGPAGLRLLESLSNCIRQLVTLIDDLAFKDVEYRILTKLYELICDSPLPETVCLRLTHQDIASMVGTVREVVSRTMSRLKRKGIVVDSTVRGFWVDRQRLEEVFQQKYLYYKN